MRDDLPSRRRVLALTGTAIATGLAGCSGGDGGGSTPTEAPTETSGGMTTTSGPPEPALEVQDASSDDGTIVIPRAAIDGTGWLVVHPEADGGGPNGGVVLAQRMLGAGTYENLALSLPEPVSESQTLYAMLHYDDPADGEFTFPQNGDPPVTADGSPVLKPFSLTVEGGDMSGGTTTVEMENTSFSPVRVGVDPGTTVEWVNRDGYGHDVQSAAFHDAAADWDFQSSTLNQGDTTRYTFEEAGVYEYDCSIHGEDTMCGAVLVGDVTLDGQLPCEM